MKDSNDQHSELVSQVRTLFDDLNDCRRYVHRKLNDVEDKQEQLQLTVTTMHEDLRRMREILEAWNKAQGFLAVLKFMGSLSKILAPIAALGAIIAFAWHQINWWGK